MVAELKLVDSCAGLSVIDSSQISMILDEWLRVDPELIRVFTSHIR